MPQSSSTASNAVPPRLDANRQSPSASTRLPHPPRSVRQSEQDEHILESTTRVKSRPGRHLSLTEYEQGPKHIPVCNADGTRSSFFPHPARGISSPASTLESRRARYSSSPNFSPLPGGNKADSGQYLARSLFFRSYRYTSGSLLCCSDDPSQQRSNGTSFFHPRPILLGPKQAGALQTAPNPGQAEKQPQPSEAYKPSNEDNSRT